MSSSNHTEGRNTEGRLSTGKRSRAPLSNLFIAMLLLVSLITAFFLVRYAVDKYKHLQGERVNPVVKAFLDEYFTSAHSMHVGEDPIFRTYFSHLEWVFESDVQTGKMIPKYTTAQEAFEDVIWSYTSAICDYEVEVLSSHFLKIVPVTKSGERLYPPIGLWYNVQSDRISEWYLCRLTPFSTYDEEYREYWS